MRFVLCSSVSIDLQCLQLSVAIRGESNTLFLFPNLNETLDGCQGELLLLLSQFTVLPHSIKADYVLLVLSSEIVKLDDGPLFLLGLPLLTLCLSGILGLLLSIFKCLDLGLLLLHPFRVVLPIGNSFGQRLVKEAALVDERDGHEGAKLRNALEVHAGLTHDFLDVVVLEALKNGQLCLGLLVLSFGVLAADDGLIQATVLLTEDIMSDSNCGWEHGALHELMIFARMDELDHLGRFVVQMRLIVVIDPDLPLRVLQTTDVDSGRPGEFLQELGEGRQVVSQVL